MLYVLYDQQWHMNWQLASRAAQFDYANTNEINTDINLANSLLKLGNGMYLFVHLALSTTDYPSQKLLTDNF